MKEVSYRCDLCKNPKEINTLFGITWKGVFNKELPTVHKSPKVTESHICYDCAYAIKDFVIDVDKEDK